MTTEPSEYTGKILCGDALGVLRELPDCSAHCCVTSPPYWGLRDYGCEGQMGLEPTPEAYVARMVEVFGEVRRVLRDDGTLWLNVGDTYSGYHGNAKCDDEDAPSNKPGYVENMRESTVGVDGLKPKDLCMIPARLALALQQDGWYLRSDIVWSKPNPMPESVRARPTKAHEYVFLLAKSQRYYFDADAVREEASTNSHGGGREGQHRYTNASGRGDKGSLQNAQPAGPSGRNIRDVWTIPTSPCPEAHFAVMPPKLVEPCIKAGTSEKGCCPECGAPWRRKVERVDVGMAESGARGPYTDAAGGNRSVISGGNSKRVNALPGYGKPGSADLAPRVVRTLGWEPACTCDAGEPVPCTALDPFFGAGTVGLVAQGLGRRFVGIELNPEYVAIAERRIAEARRKHQPTLKLLEGPA